MMRPGMALTAALAAVGVLIASTRWTLRAQDGPRRPEAPATVEPGHAGHSVQEAMLHPLDLPFARETTLEDAAEYLRAALKAPVVLDLAALKRRRLTPESTVRLDLKGVRLKTALALLLDQVGLTYRVVAEDNLLVLTDAQGAADPMERVLIELKSLHKDIFELRDAVEDVYELVAPEEEMGPAMRTPTIIEELPEDPDAAPPSHGKPG